LGLEGETTFSPAEASTDCCNETLRFHARLIPLFSGIGERRAICLGVPESRIAHERRSKHELKEVDAVIERLRDFIRLNYTTAADVARQIGVRDTTIYDWLLGKASPAKPGRIAAFLNFVTKRPRIRHRSNRI
jgi:hypothetical protein